MFIFGQVRGFAIAAVLTGLACVAQAEESAADWPSKPIEIVVLNSPGGASDIFARHLARAAEPIFGQPVVVVNKPGGSGATQMNVVKSAKPDGYTIGVNTLSHFTALKTNLAGTFSKDDFDWISLLQEDSYLLFVNADSPYKTFGDLVSAVKAEGGAVNIGGFGAIGSTSNIATELVTNAAGIETNWISYKSSSDTVVAVLGGHVTVGSGNPGPIMEFLQAGRVRVLGVLANERSPVLPDVPTFAEQGIAVGGDWSQVRGIFAPKGVPEDIQEKIADAMKIAIQDPEYLNYQTTSGIVSKFLGPVEYRAYVDRLDTLAQEGLAAAGISQ
jgi:tripartite-type tricarboxylate transporter receptor subunit TctC